MHINTVIMKAVSCPPWFQTVQRNNLEAQCTKTKVNTQRIPASGGVVSMVTNTNWCKCASVNEREREQQKRTKYAYTVWSCAYNRTVVKIKKLWFFCKKPFVSRCINTHTHTPWGDCCELVQYKQNRTELNKMIMWYIKEEENNTWDKILSACCLPETACSIAQHLGCMDVELAVIMVIWGGVPVRVGYDDTIGQNGQGILDDWHLQCITWWQVPKHTCIWMCSENKKHYPIYV